MNCELGTSYKLAPAGEVWNDTDNTKFFNDIGLGDGRDKKENGLMIWDNEKMATANSQQ